MTSRIARITTTGRRHFVELPEACHFDRTQVFIRRDQSTGDVIRSDKREIIERLVA